eukprot:scaffold78141_cov47-Cyclotella_meneghiniana.AAC.1
MGQQSAPRSLCWVLSGSFNKCASSLQSQDSAHLPAISYEVERNEIFAQLFTSSRERFVDKWLTPTERLARQDLASSEGAVAPEGAT